jgi:dephospho-CoA kinase
MKLKEQFVRLTQQQRLYSLPVPLIGLTGGIASGKSTVAEILKQENYALIDADQLVKHIYQQAETKDFVRSLVPEAMDGQKINFPRLRQSFFHNPSIKSSIENWIYQRLPQTFLAAYQAHQNPGCIVYDVPLLFEKNMQSQFDITILVYAPRSLQKLRLQQRDGINAELSENILNQQMDIEKKRSLAGFIIDNSGPKEELAAKTLQILRQLFSSN